MNKLTKLCSDSSQTSLRERSVTLKHEPGALNKNLYYCKQNFERACVSYKFTSTPQTLYREMKKKRKSHC